MFEPKIKRKKIDLMGQYAYSGILFFILIFSAAYAVVFFLHNEEIVKGNLTSDLVTIEVSDNGSISLTDTSPKTDENGLNGDSQVITLTNTSKIDTLYSISLISDDTSNIDTSSIRYGLYINGVLKKTDNLGPSNIIYEGLLLQDESINVEVYFWVDSNYTGSGTSFSGSFNIEADEAVLTMTNYVSKLVGKNKGVFKVNDDYRYSGSDSDNYIWFNCKDGTTGGSDNCELWRIVGSFNVKANSYANSYQRLKIVKEENLSNRAFGSNNKFSTASVNTYLNSDYYNSLTTSAKSMIIDSEWNVGNTALTSIPSDSLTNEIKSKVYAKIGLLSASDIGYSADISNHTKALNNADLYASSWLKGKGYYTLTPITSSTTTVIGASTTAVSSITTSTSSPLKPSVYLIPNVYIKAGNGTIDKPYELNYIDTEEYYSDVPVVGYITYDVNGKDVETPSKQSIYAGGNTVITGGFDDSTFLGWATTADGEVVYQKGDIITGTSSVTLYAKWNIPEYLVDKITNTLSLTEADTDGTRFVYGADVDNNYVWYSGKLWRVVSVNSDNTIKLIAKENMTTMYWTEDFEVEYIDSDIRTWLITDFLPTLENYDKFLVDHNWDYTTYEDFPTTKLAPTGTVTEKVGLLNIYEYMMTGGVYRSSDSNSFLEDSSFWTMSSNGMYGFWNIIVDGYAMFQPLMEEDGVRPSIVLNSKVLVGDVDGDGNSGSGTAIDPYEIYVDTSADTTAPVCVFSGPSVDTIYNDKQPIQTEFYITCTDENGLDDSEITTSEIVSNKVTNGVEFILQVDSITKSEVNNGYKYTVTVSAANNIMLYDGTLTLMEGAVTDSSGNKNSAITSDSVYVGIFGSGSGGSN